MARKFLYFIAFMVVLALAGLLAYRAYGPQLLRWTLVPKAKFVAQAPMPANEWSRREMWIARPDIPNNPSQWLPTGFTADAPRGRAAVFFIHPTSYLLSDSWNAALDNVDANNRAALFVRGQASAFSGVGDIYAPRYRQATFGAFLTGQREAQLALDTAYRDVLAAFDAFLAAVPADQPIILAGHSQGSLHLVRLLHDRVAGKPLAGRIVAAYAVGWPISLDADMPALGLPACNNPAQANCLISWQSFAEPADPQQIVELYNRTNGYTGRSRRGTRMVCTNPLTGTLGGSAPAAANLGAVVPSADLKSGTVAKGAIPARCGEQGFLLIGEPPKGFGTYVLPGNNYHVFDYSLFWSNVRADAARRLGTFIGTRR